MAKIYRLVKLIMFDMFEFSGDVSMKTLVRK